MRAATLCLVLFVLPSTLHAAPLEVLVLGSGGPGASGRASASYVVFVDGVARILVDAGSGSFVRLGEAKVPLAQLDVVLLTHLHIDHTGELPGLFKARAVAGRGPIGFDVWGPKGAPPFPATSEFIELLFGPKGAFAYLRDFAAPMTIHAHDFAEAAPREIRAMGDLAITAIAGHHGDAPAVIYRIDHGGRSVTFSGDIDEKGLSPAILYTLHSPPRAIGKVAAEAGVHALLLSHIGSDVDQERDAVLASIRKSYAGPITFAKDGQRLQPQRPMIWGAIHA